MKDSMKGEVLFVHGAKPFWNAHEGLKQFKENGGNVVNSYSPKVTMVAVYDPADLKPLRYAMNQEAFDELSKALHYAGEKNLPILTADELAEKFKQQEALKRQSMFDHLADTQPAGVVFF